MKNIVESNIIFLGHKIWFEIEGDEDIAYKLKVAEKVLDSIFKQCEYPIK